MCQVRVLFVHWQMNFVILFVVYSAAKIWKNSFMQGKLFPNHYLCREKPNRHATHETLHRRHRRFRTHP